MIVAPKTASALFTLENALARFELMDGDGDFEYVGVQEAELKGTGSSVVFFALRGLWEIVCVRPTRDVETEHFKVVLPSSSAPVAALSAITGGQRVTLTWSDLLVDGDMTDTDLDRLNVVAEIDLMDDEAYLRMRIRAFWSVNNVSVEVKPGAYAIWRVRFPIMEVIPTSRQSLTVPDDDIGDDALVVPECHGIVVDNPESRSGGDPVMGVWAPQDRGELVRNVIRPGCHWRQTYPGKISTQVMGYYGKTSGRGVLLGVLDPVGRIKDLEASGGPGSIRMAVIHVPAWCYSVGNRPSGFTGAQEGDHQDAYLALGSHLPQSEQALPDLDQQVPDARGLNVGGEVVADSDNANMGEGGLGEMALGWPGSVNTNRLLTLGYESEFDCVLQATQGYGPEGWNATAAAWRSITELPSAAFPLRETEDDPELPQPAAGSSVLLEMDGSVHEGQRSMLGLDDLDPIGAKAASGGVVLDVESVRDLIVPFEIVAPRAALNDIDVLEAENLIESRSVLGSDGAASDLANAEIGEVGRGYLRVWGDDGFYVANQQLEEGDLFGGFLDTKGLTFDSFDPVAAGVRVGDIVRIITPIGQVFGPSFGRADSASVKGSDSEILNVQDTDRQVRVVVGFGVSANTLIVGEYSAGELFAHHFSSTDQNNPGFKFEVEIMREELNSRVISPVSISGGVRVTMQIDATILTRVYPQSSLEWAEAVEIDGIEYPFQAMYASGFEAFLEFDPQGQEASFFGGKTVRVRRAVAPVDFISVGVGEGDHILISPTTLNGSERKIEFGDTDDATALLRDGYLGFSQPLVPEEAPAGGFIVTSYSAAAGANRLLGPEIDIAAAGRRFVDTGIFASGGFAAIARSGDVLLVTNALVAANQDPFVIEEVAGDSELLVDRDFITEEDPGGGFTYRLLRRGSVVRDLSRGSSGFRPLRSGPRALLFDGRDRVHFLGIGFLADPSLPITGVFGVDSDSWAALGSNPYVPAASVNLTTYRVNTRAVRKPSQEFIITGLEGARIQLARGWELEDSTFGVTFSDVGAKTFEKNFIQYRIVRDDRALTDVYDWQGSTDAIAAWKEALETSALLAIMRGWQPGRLGWEQPGFRPPRGRYLEFLAGVTERVISASDVHQIRPGGDSGAYAAFNLAAASYFNRFGLRSGETPAGDPATGESDELVHPGVPFAQRFILEEVFGLLVQDGIPEFLMDHLEEGSRPQYGSPHYFRPLDDLPGDPTEFEVTGHGGGPSFAEGWRKVVALARRGRAVTTPMDWLLGQVDFSTRDWGDIEHSFPDVELEVIAPLAVATISVVAEVVTWGANDFAAVLEEMYGEDQVIEPGDLFELLPSGTRHVIKSVGTTLTLEGSPTIGADTQWRVLLRRNFAQESVNAPSFFHFAFGEFATVAADVTFLANDISWQEVIEQRGIGLTEGQYTTLVTEAFSRAMYRTAVASLRGLLPSIRVESEGSQRVPQEILGYQSERPGTDHLPAQDSVQFPVGAVPNYDLIGTYLAYLRSLAGRLNEVKSFVRFGPSEQSPTISGSTSNQVHGVQQSPGRRLPVVQGACFADEGGDLLFAATHWAPGPIGDGSVEGVSLSWTFSERGITSGYWAAVEIKRGMENAVIAAVVDVGAAPTTVGSYDFGIGPLQTRLFLLYQQVVIVRLDSSSVEVDRVLVVPAGRSVAAAFDTISLDVVKGGSGNYVVVVGEGAILGGLDVPSISGATIELQRSTDGNPQIGEAL